MKHDRWLKTIEWLLVAVYIGFILTKTIFGRQVQNEQIFRGLFWEIEVGYWSDIVKNIALFIPLGFLIGGRKGLIIGFCLSCIIELIQYFGCLGFCELDDILNNTIGSGIGTMLRTAINYIFPKKQGGTKEGK